MTTSLLLGAADTVQLPSWAVTAFVALFALVVSIAGFGLRYLGKRIHDDILLLRREVKLLNDRVRTGHDRLLVLETRDETREARGGRIFPRAQTPAPVGQGT